MQKTSLRVLKSPFIYIILCNSCRLLKNHFTNRVTDKKLLEQTMNMEVSSIEKKKWELARQFTKTYKAHVKDHIAIREAKCLEVLFPAVLGDVREHDLIAGRTAFYPFAGFAFTSPPDSLWWRERSQLINAYVKKEKITKSIDEQQRLIHSSCGFYHMKQHLEALQEKYGESSPEWTEIGDLIDFWEKESATTKYISLLPDEIKERYGANSNANGYVNIFFRQVCASLDYDMLLTLGIPGLIEKIQDKKAAALQAGQDSGLFEGMLIAMNLIIDICLYYEKKISGMAAVETDGERKQELLDMAQVCKNLTQNKPATLWEAAQLFWFYNAVSAMDNYGRMDVFLGDFYANDIDNGTISKEKADRLLQCIWQLIYDIREINGNNKFMARIIVGGKGRRNEKNADRFALSAMDITREMHTSEPNLTLRFYSGQDPALFEKALDVIADGCIHPSLYNDDINIPWMQKTYKTTYEDAEQYLPAGCGEYVIEGKSLNSPNATINYAAALDLALHDGYDTISGTQMGIKTGTLDSYKTFDDLYNAFKQQVDYTNTLLAKRHQVELQAESESTSLLYMSILNHECIEKGKSIIDGGPRYNGAIIESFGLTNTADSLYVIKECVYNKKIMSLEKMVEILDADYEGYEKERQLFIDLPKYGNDNEDVDTLLMDIHDYICENTMEKAAGADFDYFTICNMNPGGFGYGQFTKATSDGRKHGEPLTIGNTPTSGRDIEGITALLNSMAKPKPYHAGYVQNLKTTPELLKDENRVKFKAALDTYFQEGGTQIMITAINQKDLEDALLNPDKHQNLLVRIGGYTTKFVALGEKLQQEVIQRVIYC